MDKQFGINKTVLITGGCGYIGRTMVEKLLKHNYNVIVIDSLVNSCEKAIHPDTIFYKEDIRDEKALDLIFSNHKIDLVMDFAALISVEESMKNIKEYYDVNVNGLLNILEHMKKYNVKDIIFSSTAAVYEDSEVMVNESSNIKPLSVYGETKLIGENILKYYSEIHNINHVIFRYFNVAGGRKVGYEWNDFPSIIPKMITAITCGETFVINGNQYPTLDGTTIRDYIHMNDLIEAHYLVVENFECMKNNIYNLGLGKGTSILELINAVEKVYEVNVKKKYGENRKGDIIFSVADSRKFKNTVSWNIEYKSIEEIIKDIYEESLRCDERFNSNTGI